MTSVKSFEKVAFDPISIGALGALLGKGAIAGKAALTGKAAIAAGAALAGAGARHFLPEGKSILREGVHRGKGIWSAARGNTSERMALAAKEALTSQRNKHLMVGGGAATGLAGLTYLKGKEDMKKHAGLAHFFGKEKTFIEKYLKDLPTDTKKHLLKKIKVKKGHLYAAGAGLTASGATVGAVGTHMHERK